MSDTPETDHLETELGQTALQAHPVIWKNSRKLERERDEARRKLEDLDVAAIHSCHNECQRPMCVLRRERDEAQYKLEDARQSLEVALEDLSEAKRERDELLERNAKLRDIADRALMLNQTQ
jgi:phage shock protein A